MADTSMRFTYQYYGEFVVANCRVNAEETPIARELYARDWITSLAQKHPEMDGSALVKLMHDEAQKIAQEVPPLLHMDIRSEHGVATVRVSSNSEASANGLIGAIHARKVLVNPYDRTPDTKLSVIPESLPAIFQTFVDEVAERRPHARFSGFELEMEFLLNAASFPLDAFVKADPNGNGKGRLSIENSLTVSVPVLQEGRMKGSVVWVQPEYERRLTDLHTKYEKPFALDILHGYPGDATYHLKPFGLRNSLEDTIAMLSDPYGQGGLPMLSVSERDCYLQAISRHKPPQGTEPGRGGRG